jgi:hypothetical protein
LIAASFDRRRLITDGNKVLSKSIGFSWLASVKQGLRVLRYQFHEVGLTVDAGLLK